MQISIIGAGGHTRSLINILGRHVDFVDGIYDDNYIEGESIGDFCVLGPVAAIPQNHLVIISVGDAMSRYQLFKKFNNRILPSNLIHKDAIIEPYIKMGKANQIFSRVVVNTNASIGDFNLLNTASVIEHEVQIGNYNHIAPGAILCGRAKLGSHCLVGAGATVTDKVSILDRAIIGAGATVVTSIDEPGTYIGIPAKKQEL
jgi:UDP-N-acetylbacillosamine N-acetyltransferase